MTHRPWDVAWHDALYGPAGFYRRPEGPAGHFRTAAHASGRLGAALARLARSSGCEAVVDVGAGRGELLVAVHAADADLDLTGVDVVPRPDDLPPAIAWSNAAPDAMTRTLLVGTELLDVVPCPVLEVGPDGEAHVVEVDRDGSERLGAPAGPADLRWAARWWPTADPRARIEVGRTRDELWASLVHRVSDGLALAVDYGHTADRRPASGSLTGYRGGRQVAPVPDGSSDLTAHVALDALVEVAPHGLLLTQAEALGRLGIGADRPSVGAAAGDPMAYLAALSASSEAHELLDPGGLGAFGWVLHPRGDAASRLVTEWTHGAPS